MPKTEKLKPYETAESVRHKRMMAKTKKIVEKKNITLEKLKVEYIPIDLLKPNDWNPNRQDDHDFELLCRSIEEDGFTQPVLAHKDTNIIIDGEHRWRAAKVLNFKEIPIVKVDMPLEQMKLSTIRHNRARGSHDIELEAEIIKDLANLNELDWVKESLLLDNKDIEKFLEETEAPEVFAQDEYSEAWEPGENITEVKTTKGKNREVNTSLKAINKQREKENKLKEAKSEEEKKAIEKDSDLHIITFTTTKEEAKLIKEILGKNPVKRLIELCNNEKEKTTKL